VNGDGLDRCERCGDLLGIPIRPLFRLQNVTTKRRDRINSDEEERLRLGYELKTGLRFTEHGGRPSHRIATVELNGQALARLDYGSSATLWRINLGWRRRLNKNQHGFVLDTERGYWATNDIAPEEDDADPMSFRTMRVIPYVEDRRNCLLFEPQERFSAELMASLSAALKSAIQINYQLEDSELAAEALPNENDRRLILLYEAAAGGAGVLRLLLDDPQAVAEVAREALRLCHFDPKTGADKKRGPRAREDCEAACYDCLLNYGNQRDHKLLDRKLIRELLMQLSEAHVIASPVSAPRAEHLAQLKNAAGSQLAQQWLAYLEQRNLRLPSKAEAFVEPCQTRPDFLYEDCLAAIYVDGPPHDYPERHARDSSQTACMEDLGYTVIRFHHEESWQEKIDQFPSVFGKLS
jgi:very-short-patch-repair endonuclease